MKIFWVRCNVNFRVKSMYIVGEVEKFLNHMLHSSETLKGLSCKDFLIEEVQKLQLDPGGMCMANPQEAKFNIDGVEFYINWDQISGVLHCLENADERLEGYQRFSQWKWNTVLPQALYEKLKKELKKLSMTSEALHASLDRENAREQAEKDGILVRFDKLAQLSPEQARKKLKEFGVFPKEDSEEEEDDWWK